MGRKQKKKQSPKKKQTIETKTISTEEVLSKSEIGSENIVRLKLTTRKGTRIESVPLKKLRKIANKSKLIWELKDEWLILYALS